MTHAMAEAKVVPDRKEFDRLEREALRLVKIAGQTYMDLAQVLYDIREQFKMCHGDTKEAKKALGHERFEDWTKDKLGFERRKGFYFVDVWETLHVEAGIPKKEIERIEWTKARELTPLAKPKPGKPKLLDWKQDRDGAEKWIEKAEKAETNEALKADVQKALVLGNGQAPEKINRVSISLYDEQLKNHQAAMDTARVLTGSEKPSFWWDMICLEFNTSHQREGESRDDAIARVCAATQRLFGVKLIVIDPKSKEVLFGEDEIKSLPA